MILKTLAALKPERLSDGGYGCESFTTQFAIFGAQVEAIDPSEL